jgi:small subunit ribosomal protein S2
MVKKSKIDLPKEGKALEDLVEEMSKAGVGFGHRTSKLHPKMAPYILGIKSTIHIIDLEKTIAELRKTLAFIEELFLKNKSLLLIGTKVQFRELVEEVAKDCNLPYVNQRWIGGALTNFSVISQRIKQLEKMEEDKQKGNWEKYSKKERLSLDNERQKLEEKFGGLRTMKSKPEAVFILDLDKNALAAREARKEGIKVVALVDTNIDPSLADYPIPASDDAITSARFILDYLRKTIKEAQIQASKEEIKKED